MPTEIIIDKNNEGVSPKTFLKRTIDEPYHTLFKLMKEKRITLNGKKIKDDTKLKTGDIIKLWKDDIKLIKKEIPKNITPKNLNIETIFENEDFLILNKPPQVVVQGAQDNELSLSYHLQYLKDKNKDINDFQYFHVHRLDKETSGVLACAKNQIALRELNRIFRDRETKKIYICLCIGKPKNKEGKVELNLDRTEQGSKEKVKIVREGGKKSLSFYKVIEEYNYQGQILSLIEVEIKTGVTHQIRIHMKHLGCPIVGDKMYGNSYVNKIFENILDRQFLHAKNLEFTFNNQKYSFETKLTKDLKDTIKFIS